MKSGPEAWDVTVKLGWIKAHMGILGNEAEMIESDTEEVKPPLKKIPLNKSELHHGAKGKEKGERR